MLRWLKGRGARPSAVAEMQARISPELWHQVLRAHPFLAALDDQEGAQLLARSAWLLASKSINGAQGLDVTDAMRLSIAAQASLPILNLTPSLYEGWNEIIVYPAGFRIPRSRQDADGVVHEYIEDAAGEAWDGGPVILSWEDAQLSDGGFNVVIHEFAHKLDMRSGPADGVPPLPPGIARRDWETTLLAAYDDFCARVDAAEEAAERQGEQALDAFGDEFIEENGLDPYGAESPGEFFAVMSETFFEDPHTLRAAYPALYALMTRFYRQDPAARLDGASAAAAV